MVVLAAVAGNPIYISQWGCFCRFSHRCLSAQFAGVKIPLKQRESMCPIVEQVCWGFDQVSRTGEVTKRVVIQPCSPCFQTVIRHSFQHDIESPIIPRILFNVFLNSSFLPCYPHNLRIPPCDHIMKVSDTKIHFHQLNLRSTTLCFYLCVTIIQPLNNAPFKGLEELGDYKIREGKFLIALYGLIYTSFLWRGKYSLCILYIHICIQRIYMYIEDTCIHVYRGYQRPDLLMRNIFQRSQKV